MGIISIRPMKKEDISLVSHLIFISFWQKMLPLHALTEEEALRLIEGLMFSDPRSMGYYSVATLDDKVVGMIKLKEFEDKEDFIFNDHKMLLKIGVVKLIKAGILLSALDTKVQKGHLYVEMIAIDEGHRGQGIGSKLLEFATNRGKSRDNIRTISLHVIEKNVKAKALYERIGFRAIRSQWNSVVKGLGGIRKVYFMVKDI